MPVALMLPTSNGCGEWRGEMPLTSAQRYVRGSGNSRWHRVRAAVVYPAGTYEWWPDDRTVYTFWCGPSAATKDGLMLADDVSTDEPVCGPCVGRALGAKQDEIPPGLPLLRFDPRWQTPPRWCPGSGKTSLFRRLGRGDWVGQCMACGEYVSVRANRWPRDGYGMKNHPPGPDLCDPCPFHGWNRVHGKDGRVRCFCGWPYDLGRAAPKEGT